MGLEPLKLKISWYVVDVEQKLIVDEIEGPSDKPWVIRNKAQKSADSYAAKTGHSTVVVKPESYH